MAFQNGRSKKFRGCGLKQSQLLIKSFGGVLFVNLFVYSRLLLSDVNGIFFFLFFFNTGKRKIECVKEMSALTIPCGATCDAESLP